MTWSAPARVAAAMRATPINDAFTHDVPIRAGWEDETLAALDACANGRTHADGATIDWIAMFLISGGVYIASGGLLPPDGSDTEWRLDKPIE